MRWTVIVFLGFGKSVLSHDHVFDAFIIVKIVSSLCSEREVRLSLADRMKIIRYICDRNRDFSFLIKSAVDSLKYLELDGKSL